MGREWDLHGTGKGIQATDEGFVRPLASFEAKLFAFKLSSFQETKTRRPLLLLSVLITLNFFQLKL